MIKGKEIILRHVSAADIEPLIGFLNNGELKGEYSRTLLKSPSAFKREFELTGFATEASELFVIVDKSNQIVGTIGHFSTVHYSSARELGFSIFPCESKNKGFATQAVTLLTRYLFESYPINRVQIFMPVDHEACEKVAVKSGFTKEGILRGFIFVRGSYLDTFAYSLLRCEYEKLPNSNAPNE